ncbi:radical SAM protein [Blautia sp. XA-2221]|uniref:radical SAM protein n=1 Tax=Blautia sp. XA-2221 TaxID=2903961 RepID=UPI002379147C|nr:radical SAM protein [Blautia sp. XA-2221]
MERYSRITDKNKREIVLLRAFPCVWGKCTFCDYIEDNGRDEAEMVRENREALKEITGEFGVLEVINSGSCFELPKQTLEEIRRVVQDKNIKRLIFESHWIYRKRLQEMRDYFGIPVTYKMGVETFDYDFREKVLNKHADFKTPQEAAEYFDSICLMVGIKGQTKEMIRNDIAWLKEYFNHGTVNVFNNNSTPIKRDEELVRWFMEEYQWLLDDPDVEVLYEITDFGVG